MSKLIVIGGGPGGYSAAIRAAQLGAEVCLIEKEHLGGTCLNRGCIPTKTLYRTAEVLQNIKEAAHFGIHVGEPTIDAVAVHNRCVSVTEQLRGGIEQLIKAKGIEKLNGMASFKDAQTVTVSLADGTTVERTADHILIATGSVPAIPPIPGSDLPGVISSDELLAMDRVPESLIVVGGGVIGIEFASIYNAFGSQVTVVEMLPNVLAQVDTDITKRFASMLKRKGINVNTGAKVLKIEAGQTEAGKACLNVTVEIKGKEQVLSAENVLMAVGRKPALNGLNLEITGVEHTGRGIPVDAHLKTNIEGLYAIGDVTGGIMLAHWAAHQGVHAVEHMFSTEPGTEMGPVPGCIFTFPEISMVGLTESEAKEAYGEVKIGKFMFGANGKALALGEAEGFVKVVATTEGQILGVHIMGPHASDLIHEGVVAVTQKMNVRDFRGIIHAHPTLGESLHEAFLAIIGEAIHQI